MSEIKMYIANEEVVSNQTFTIKEETLSASSTILNNCYPKSWEDTKDYVSNFYYPKDYSACKILKDDELIFAGIVKNSGTISLNPRYPHYCSLQILDYKTLLSEGKTLDFVISEKTIKQAIELVTDAIADYGFEVGVINIASANDIIGAYSTLDQTAYDVYQYLSEISGARWFTRRIDENKIAIDFYDPETIPVADSILYTTEYFENNNIVDISFSYGTRDYRNRQAILSDQVYASILTSDTLISDGYSTNYITSQAIGIMSSIRVSGEEKTFATKEEKDLGLYADFYYTPGENSIEASDNYSANTNIVVTYTALVKGRQIATNNSEINRINSQINRNGTISRYENRNDILDINELNKVAQTYIKYKGKAEINLVVKTKDKDIFKVGQQTYFDAPIEELKTDYLVKTKEIEITQSGTQELIFYTYTLSSNFDSETAINYFDNQRRKNQGNLQGNSVITRNIDIENEANIVFNNLECNEYDNTYDNLLDAPLNAPFIK